ncbi:MAG: tetratricopeptide repeat protein [Acidobacteriota bacterium]
MLIGGRYEVLRTLGTGAGGRVELVRGRLDGRQHALKWVPLDEPERVETLRDEWRLRRELSHPQLPALHDVGCDDERAYFVMRNVEGLDLAESLSQRGEALLPELLLQALNVVAFLHGRRIVHGDLKPEHFLVDAGDSPRLRLVDFGLSLAIDGEASSSPLRGGTRAYLAPSTLRDGQVSASTDLYALGLSFRHALGEQHGPDDGSTVGTARRVIDRLAEADDDFRYDTATRALAELSQALPGHGSLPRPEESPLLGQEATWTSLVTTATRREREPEDATALLLTGPAGAGKTRLLKELHLEASLRDLTSLRLDASTVTGGGELLEELERRLVVTGVSSAPSSKRIETREKKARTLGSALCRASRRRPLILAIDHLDRLEPSALPLIASLVQGQRDEGARVVLAARDDGAAARVMAAEAELQELPVPALSDADSHELIRLLRHPLEDDSVQGLALLANGNPGLATLLGRVGPKELEAVSDEERLLLLLERQLATVTEPDQEVLLALAVLRQPVDVEVLAAVHGAEPTWLAGRLEGLMERGLVALDDAVEGRHGLADASLRRVLLGRLGEESKRRLHQAALTAWTERDAPAGVLLRHALAAGLTEQALTHAHLALPRMMTSGEFAEHLALTAGLLELDGVDEGERAWLREQRAEGALRLGSVTEARETLDELLAEADGEDGDDTVRARRGRALLLEASLHEKEGSLEKALDSLERAEAFAASLTERDQLRLAERLGAVRYGLGDYATARATWEGALADGPDLDDSVIADLHNDLGVVASRQLELETATRHHRHALAVRQRRGDRDGESRSLTNLATIAFKRGDFGRAGELYTESLALKRELGTLREQAVALTNLGMVATHQGDYAIALRSFEEAVELHARSGDVLGEANTRVQAAELYLEKGRHQQALAEVDLTRLLVRGGGARGGLDLGLMVLEARLAFELGHFDEVRDLLPRCLAEAERLKDQRALLDLHLLDCRLQLCRDDASSARAAVGRAAAAQADAWGEGWVHFHRARCHLHAGGPDGHRDLEAAMGLGRHLGARRLQASAHLLGARLESEAGLLDEAAAHLSAASPLVDRLGSWDLRLELWGLKGLHALACGQRDRAIAWWTRGVETIRASLISVPDESCFTQHPERAWIVEALDALLTPLEAAPGGTT